MAGLKYPTNPSKSAPTPRKTPTAVRKFEQYRETKSGHSGRTSSGKAMQGPKAGRGSTC